MMASLIAKIIADINSEPVDSNIWCPQHHIGKLIVEREEEEQGGKKEKKQ